MNTPLASYLGLLSRFFPKLCLVTRLIPPFLLCCVCLTVLVSALWSPLPPAYTWRGWWMKSPLYAAVFMFLHGAKFTSDINWEIWGFSGGDIVCVWREQRGKLSVQLTHLPNGWGLKLGQECRVRERFDVQFLSCLWSLQGATYQMNQHNDCNLCFTSLVLHLPCASPPSLSTIIRGNSNGDRLPDTLFPTRRIKLTLPQSVIV